MSNGTSKKFHVLSAASVGVNTAEAAQNDQDAPGKASFPALTTNASSLHGNKTQVE